MPSGKLRKAFVRGLGVVVCCAAAAAAAAAAADLRVDGRLQPFVLQDQRGQDHPVDAGTRLLLFSRDRSLTRMAFRVLDREGGSYLAERHACFILDISAMPSVIAWAVARPRMRRHPFPLLLDVGPGPTRNLPTQAGMLTLVYLNQLKVEQIAYVSSEAELDRALQALGI
jgi:hypothetical protein